MCLYSFFLQFKSSTQDSTCLHLSYFRICISQTATAVTQHRIVFTQRFYTLLDILQAYTHRISHFLLSLRIMRNKLMQRRIEQTNSHRTTGHCFKDALKVGLLIRKNLSECFTTSFCIFCQNHFAHCFDLFTFEEHMFRTAKTDTYCTKVTCYFRIVRSIRIGTYLQTGIFIREFHQIGKVSGKFGSLSFYLTIIYFACTTVQRNIIAFFQNNAVNFYCTSLIVDVQCSCTGYTTFTHTTSYHSSMRSHTTTSCQDTFGNCHTGQVFRRSLDTYHYHFLSGSMPFGGIISEEYNLTGCSTRRSRKTASQHFRLFQSRFIEYRVKKFIQFVRFYTHQSSLFINHALTEQVHCDFHHSRTGTFTVTSLQEP